MFIYNLVIFLLIMAAIFDLIKAPIRNIAFYFNFSFIFALATFRYGLGADYFQYVELFNQAIPINKVDFSYFIEHPKGIEILYLVLESIVKYFTSDYINFLVIYNFILFGFLLKGIKYFDNYNIQLFIFFSTVFLLYFIDTYRQAMAMAVFYYSIRFILEKRFSRYLFWMIFASFFHKISLLAIPLYFIVNLEYRRKLTFLFLISSFLFYYYDISGIIIKFLYSNLNEISFIRRVHHYYFIKESGGDMSIFAFLHRIIILSVIFYYFYKVNGNIRNLIIIYFILFFMFANIGVIAGRVSALFIMAYMCYFSNIFSNIRERDKVILFCIVVSYFSILFYKDLNRIHHLFGNQVYLPYDSIFFH